MTSTAVSAALEQAALSIARLDSRISASPLAEAWQIRATILAADRLAAVDGTPTRPEDISGLLSGSALASSASYGPAHVGLAHWRRCMARVQLSDLAARIVGRRKTERQASAEAREDEEAGHGPVSAASLRRVGADEDADDYALAVAERALAAMNGRVHGGSQLLGLVASLRAAIRYDPDPGYFERIHQLRLRTEKSVRDRMEEGLSALPDADGAAAHEDAGSLKRWAGEALVHSLSWERKSHLGACFSVVPDRLQELRVTQNRLSCLTGATKRLGFEGRLDDRAILGVLRQLAHEARAGLALLVRLEQLMAQIAASDAVVVDARSQLPEVVYAFLLLPATDAKWLEACLDVSERVARKFVQRLAEARIIHPAGLRRHMSAGAQRSRDVQLWSAGHFGDVSHRHRADRATDWPTPTEANPAQMLTRQRDSLVAAPASVLFARFEQEMVDIDQAFGRLWAGKRAQNPASRNLCQQNSGSQAGLAALRGLEALSGPKTGT